MGHFYFTNLLYEKWFHEKYNPFLVVPNTMVILHHTVMFACHMSHLTNCRMTKSMHSWICLKFGLVFWLFAVISITVLVDLVLVMDKYSISLGTFWLINTQRSWIRRILQGFFLLFFMGCYFCFFGLVRDEKKEKKIGISKVWSLATYQFLVNPFGAFSQKLEIWVGMDVQNIDQFCLQ